MNTGSDTVKQDDRRDEEEQRSILIVDDGRNLIIRQVPNDKSKTAENDWKCSACNLSNPSHVEQCITCLAWKSPIKADEPSGNSSNSVKIVDDGGKLAIKQIVVKEKSTTVETDWKCTSCRLSNPSYVDKCKSCLADKPGVKVQPIYPDLSNNKSLTNGSTAASAEAKVNDASSEATNVEELWPCRHCTFLNSILISKCEMCGAPKKSNVPTSVPAFTIVLPSTNIVTDTFNQLKKRLQNPKQDTGNPTKVTKTSDEMAASGSSAWTCLACSFTNNPRVAVKCDLCNTPKGEKSKKSAAPMKTNDKDTWTCDKCTLVNSVQVRDCGACGGMRNDVLDSPVRNGERTKPHYNGNDSKISAEKNKDTWECSKCTYSNQLSAHVCAICQSKRVIQLPSVDDINPNVKNASEWRCAKCTFTNGKDLSTCRMCHAQRGAAGVSRTVDIHRNHEQGAAGGHPPSLNRQNTLSLRIKDVQQEAQTNAMEAWTNIVQYCQVNKEKYVDADFPPAPKSLFHSSNKSGTVTSWMRISDVAQTFSELFSGWTVFRDPKPSDICQGILGNCWFLSSLAVLAEKPELLKQVFITKDFCPEGVYQVRLCKDGEWVTVIVDDLLPCNQYGQLVYSQAKRKQLWVPLIEKALAKIHGCYEALTAGRCVEGLATLTGAPCETIQLYPDIDQEELNILWAQLLSSREHKFLMGASCGAGQNRPGLDSKEYDRVGLINRHAYSILDVKSIEGNRLLQLRNPWGRFSWKGDWSDKSDLWKSIPKEKLNGLNSKSSGTEGIFWMSIYDFIKYFDSVDICKYRQDWMESRIYGSLYPYAHKPWTVCQMNVFENTEIDLGLFQEGLRHHKNSNRNSVDLCIAVFRSSQAVNQPLGKLVCCSKRQIQSFIGCNYILEPGSYTVVCLAFNHWSQSSEAAAPRYTLSAHSSRGLVMEEQEMSNTILADTIIQLAVAKGERHEGRPGMTTYYLTRNWAGFIMVIENRHPDASLQVKCDCSDSSNVVSTRDSLKTVDSIPPLHRQVVVVLSQLERTSGYSITHKLIHRLSAVGTGLGDWAPGANHVPALTNRVYGLHAPRPL